MPHLGLVHDLGKIQMYLMKYAHKNLLEVGNEANFFKKYWKTIHILIHITKHLKQYFPQSINNHMK